MTRKYLEELGLEKEVIDKIMSENGSDIEAARKSEQAKFDTERGQLKGQITDLSKQIETRDKDLTSIREQLTAAQADKGKLDETRQALAAMQTQYGKDKEAWEAKTAQQAYEFEIRNRANELKFSSAAAKKEFIREAIGKGFKKDGENLLGYTDFVEQYKTSDPGAFAQETPADPQTNAPTIVLPCKSGAGPHHMSLSEAMKAKNENQNFNITFD
ncbi:MAG: phage scaffolding protein [Clostridiales bacterium]|nr:phage scaffolding protein [Clostridiales bacterium]